MSSFCKKIVTCVFFIILVYSCICALISIAIHIKPYYWNYCNEIEKNKTNNLYGYFSALDRSIIITQSMYPIEIPGAIYLYGKVNNILDIKQTQNIIRLNNDKLSFLEPSRKLLASIQTICKLNEYLRSKQTPCLFILAPFKIHCSDSLLPRGIIDYSNANADNFMRALSEKEIDVFDARSIFDNQPEEHYRLFFNSDHHWKPEYAFWTCAKVASILNERYYFTISVLDIFNPDSYYAENISISPTSESKFYPNVRLGSMTRSLGSARAPMDDLTMFYPKFLTDSKFIVNKENISVEGDCQAVWKREGNYDLTENINFCQKDKTILLISDSFGCFFANYLSLTCNKLVKFDPRSNSRPIKEIIDMYKPDIIIVLFNPDCLHQISLLNTDGLLK